MSHINFHPAPGLGDLMPGFFVVPQNPIRDAVEPVTRVPHMGELLPGMFVVPQNPLRAALTGCGGGMGCGCSGSYPSLPGMDGLGFAMSDITGMIPSSLTDSFSGITDKLKAIDQKTWLMIGGGVVLLLMLTARPGRKRYKQELSDAESAYRSKVAGIRKKYPRVGGRIKAGAEAAYDAAF